MCIRDRHVFRVVFAMEGRRSQRHVVQPGHSVRHVCGHISGLPAFGAHPPGCAIDASMAGMRGGGLRRPIAASDRPFGGHVIHCVSLFPFLA